MFPKEIILKSNQTVQSIQPRIGDLPGPITRIYRVTITLCEHA